jgi:hypothetical protein
MDAMRLIASGKAAVDGIKLLYDYAEDIKDISKRGEYMRIIGQLSVDLAETQVKLAAQLEEGVSNREKIRNLEKELEELKNPSFRLVLKDGFYYKENEDTKYCTGCYDENKKLIIVTALSQHLKAYKCPVCKNVYQ